MAKIEHSVHKQILQNITRHTGSEIFQHMVINYKSKLENMGDVTLTLARLKSVISAVTKITSTDEKKDYTSSPDTLKDYLGFMSIVENTEQGIALAEVLFSTLGHKQNPHSNPAIINTAFDPVPEKGYSIEDGYKNCRIHIIDNGIPIEIQVKTKNQFVAHEATHDPIYKAPELKRETPEETKALRRFVSDKMYPYFDALAYYQLNKENMTNDEKAAVVADIRSIYIRNHEVFEQYPEVFNNACQTFASYCFIYKHHQELFADATFRDSVLQTKLIEGDIGRVFRYLNKKITMSHPNYRKHDAFNATISAIVDMPYEQFEQLNQETAGSFRQGVVVLSGIMDVLREKDIVAIEHLLRNHKEVYVGVLSDDFAETVSDHPPIFPESFRLHRAESLKGVSGAFIIDTSGKVEVPKNVKNPLAEPIIDIDGFTLLTPQPTKYDVAYVPGVYDMFHDGHMKYIESVSAREKLIGVKSDEYSIQRKGKSPFSPLKDRLPTVAAFREVTQAYATDDDILPPPEVLQRMKEVNDLGGTCAIYVGSDWINHPEKKGEQSLAELEFIKENYPFIQFDTVPRSQKDEQTVSTTAYKTRAKDVDVSTTINHSNVFFMGEQN